MWWMLNIARRLDIPWNDERGQDLVEYALLAGLLAVASGLFVPNMAASSEAFLNCPALSWDDVTTPLVNHKINRFKPLMQRVDPQQVEALLAAIKQGHS